MSNCIHCGQDVNNASMMCPAASSQGHHFPAEQSQLDRIESKLDQLLGTEIGIHDNMGSTLAERSAETTKDL